MGSYIENSAEFKIAVIMDMCENRLSYSQTVRKYGLKIFKAVGQDICCTEGSAYSLKKE